MFEEKTIELPVYDLSEGKDTAKMYVKLWISSKEAYITRKWELNGVITDTKSISLSHEQLAALGDIIAEAKK